MIRDEVEAFAAQFSKLFANRDIEAVVDMYDEQAKVLAPGAPLTEGRAGVRAILEEVFSQGAQSIDIEARDVFEGGDFVIEVGRATLAVQPAGADLVRDESKYVVVYRRQGDGSLKLLIDAFNSDELPS